MTSRSTRVLAVAGASVLAFSVAGLGHAGAGSEEGWTVDTEDCSDPDRANAPIEGTISIGSAMPLSGGAAAAAFEPAARGLEAYINYANENDLVPGYELELTIGDDQYDPALTPGVVNGLIDDGVHLFAGIIGTQNNLAVRDTLNEECIPQLNVLAGDPRFGEVADYPWTTGLLTSYEYEFGGYAQDIAANFPDSTVGAVLRQQRVRQHLDRQLQGRRRRGRVWRSSPRRPSSSATRRPRRPRCRASPTPPPTSSSRCRSAPSASRSSTSWPTPRRPIRLGAGRLHDQHVRRQPADPRRRRRERRRHLHVGGDGAHRRRQPRGRRRRTGRRVHRRDGGAGARATSSPPAAPDGTPARSPSPSWSPRPSRPTASPRRRSSTPPATSTSTRRCCARA